MSPKRKITKPKDNMNAVGEISSKPTVEKNAAKDVLGGPARTLRPRKSPTLVKQINTEAKSAKTGKKRSSEDSNKKNKSSAKAKQGNKGKKGEDSDKGEPAAKRNKLTITEEEGENEINGEPAPATSIHDFAAIDIKGELIFLKKYKGHVCIIVNVASRCGHTSSNYKEFVEIYDKYSKDKGLRILAFPCNQFGKQEPGSNEKICEFAEKRNVKFDMFEKIEVNGKNAHPLWKFLTSQMEGPKGSRIDWNFTKFLINKEGHVVNRFKSSVKPSALVTELEKYW